MNTATSQRPDSLWRLIAVAVAVCVGLAAGAVDAAAPRVALVIGNTAYADAPLKNPINDARAMAATLRGLGFEVQSLENADRITLQRAVVDFGRRLTSDTVGLFYFAGHGVQVRGANYLIPVKASIESEEEVEVEAVDVSYVLTRMAAAKNAFNIVILDACRNNPFQRAFRSVSNGLAAINAPTGTLIAYATAPGSVASDGDGANGIYTAELISAMQQPGAQMEDVFKAARARVVARTQGKQTPWETSSVIGNFSFQPQRAAADPAPAAGGGTVSVQELALWNTIKDSAKASDFETYLQRHPGGAFAKLARIRISNLAFAGAVASASPSSVPAAHRTDSAGVEAYLDRDWGSAERALKAHVQANSRSYIDMLSRGVYTQYDIKIYKATLLDVVDADAGRVNVQYEGAFYGKVGSLGDGWWSFNAIVGYILTLEGGALKVVDYRAITRT